MKQHAIRSLSRGRWSTQNNTQVRTFFYSETSYSKRQETQTTAMVSHSSDPKTPAMLAQRLIRKSIPTTVHSHARHVYLVRKPR